MAPKRGRASASADPDSSPSAAGSSPEPDQQSPEAEPQTTEPASDPAQRLPDPMDEEDDGEELIGEGMEADYREMGALDAYEEDGLDEADYEPMDAGARFRAEQELEKREVRERGTSRVPQAFLSSDGDDEEARPRRRRKEEPAPEDGGDGLEGILPDEEESGLNLEDYQGSLAEWIQTPAVSEEIKKRFKRFLTHFEPSGASETDAVSKYSHKVRQMCAANDESLQVSYLHLSHYVPILAIWVADAPTEMLELLDMAAMDVVRIMFPDYDKIHSRVHVRITDLPIQDSIRDLRQVHMGCLVKVAGVVTRRSGVFPCLKVCKYNCGNCGYVLGPFAVQGAEPRMAGTQCPSCQKKGPYTLNHEQTVYNNYQKVTLQESPGSVPPGRLPRHKEVVMTWDLIDIVRPGEEIDVTGVYVTSLDASLNRKSGFPVFATLIEANYVQKKEDADLRALTDEDQREIIRLSKEPKIRQMIIDSIAPSICGHQDIKTALALSMFGGQSKDVGGKHRIRGDINVLLLGDPGTAKSQFLKYVQKTSPRAVYTTGQGASAVGLTAAVHKDPVTREYVLEGGALVLADKGVCLIDEFDKMNDGDRTSIHEAMEQQSISISKAGIIAQLQARCAVVAAANPIKGRYDSSVSFTENVDLTEPILSRFDCICVVKDEVDPIADEALAEFVVGSHQRLHPNEEETADDSAGPNTAPGKVIDQALLRKYIMYARLHTKPVLHDVDVEKIKQVYAELRQASQSGGVSIAVRHIESIIRMSEASARLHLRDHVRNDDVNLAISVMVNSVINSQKIAVKRAFERKFGKYLVDAGDANQLLEFQLRKLFSNAAELHAIKYGSRPPSIPIAVEVEGFEAKAREMGVDDTTAFYASATFTGEADAPFGFRRATDADGSAVIVRVADLAAYERAVAGQAAAAETGDAPEEDAASL